MKTKFANQESISRDWHVVDAKEQILGRVATKVASVLRGKHKPMYSPHVDTGDFVVVLNADKIAVTGGKENKKLYWRHTGFPGGDRYTLLNKQLEAHPIRVMEHAVRGMLPKGPLGRKMFKKLKVYATDTHPHAAQSPAALEI
jgi:large subunit ribosomal protein L13